MGRYTVVVGKIVVSVFWKAGVEPSLAPFHIIYSVMCIFSSSICVLCIRTLWMIFYQHQLHILHQLHLVHQLHYQQTHKHHQKYLRHLDDCWSGQDNLHYSIYRGTSGVLYT